jgi:hypothetical protein
MQISKPKKKKTNYSQILQTYTGTQVSKRILLCSLDVKERKRNSIARFTDKAVIATENRTNYRNTKQVTEAEVGRFLYFDCK